MLVHLLSRVCVFTPIVFISVFQVDCLVCSFCFRFIGSIELQIGRKLYLKSLGVSANDCCDMETSSQASNNCCDTDSSDMENESEMKNHQNLENCVSTSSNVNISLPKGVVESLMNDEFALPYSNKFPLPSAVSCPGGCKEAYYCR